MKDPIHIFWFRRDLRLDDNAGLYTALNGEHPVLPLFIFDPEILKELPENDARVQFIYNRLIVIDEGIRKKGGALLVKYGRPEEVFKELVKNYNISAVFTNRDYEPYAIQRDQKLRQLLVNAGIPFYDFKDQVIFEKDEVVKQDGGPYTVYTPYSRRWLEMFGQTDIKTFPSEGKAGRYVKPDSDKMPGLEEIGFKEQEITIPEFDISADLIKNYAKTRDLPALDGTSRIGPHLRFGTVSIRKVVQKAADYEPTYLKELIWREFFMQILYHFPKVVDHNFKSAYDNIPWNNDEKQFKQWCDGKTGYLMVDAGMRQLNETGYMHNRVRMVTASFLCKHLLIDWRWGEAYFAEKLLDYELSSNNGNWQWAAGTGCDAAPYFRVFNPASQQEKFDPDMKYIKRWVPEFGSEQYPKPIVDHKMARERAINSYKKALK